MHDHIKGMVENILDLISRSISLYLSVKKDNITEMNKSSLNSIIQSKENSLKLLYDEYKKINPDYKVKTYDKFEEAQDVVQSKIHNIEGKIISAIDKELLQNIPSKGHDGIYTTAQSIKSNCETSMIKLDSIIHLRKDSSEAYFCLIRTTHYVIKAMELYEKAGLKEQAAYCSNLLDENKLHMNEMYEKRIILYSPQYGDTYAGISKKFGISLMQLVRENYIENPYEKPFASYLLIATDNSIE
jgi:hypothetical protein